MVVVFLFFFVLLPVFILHFFIPVDLYVSANSLMYISE